MCKFITIKGFQIHRSLTMLLTNLLRKGQNRCTETRPNSIKSCPFELIARVHTYLFDSLINYIYIYMYIYIYVTFMGTSGVHKFYFTSDSAKASHVAWEHLDYDHTADAFLLDHAFIHRTKHPPGSGVATTPCNRIYRILQSNQAIPPGRWSIGKALQILFPHRNQINVDYWFGTKSCILF